MNQPLRPLQLFVENCTVLVFSIRVYSIIFYWVILLLLCFCFCTYFFWSMSVFVFIDIEFVTWEKYERNIYLICWHSEVSLPPPEGVWGVFRCHNKVWGGRGEKLSGTTSVTSWFLACVTTYTHQDEKNIPSVSIDCPHLHNRIKF